MKVRVDFDYNLVEDGLAGILVQADILDYGANNLDEDPLMLDPQFGYFELLSRSPCVDAGTALYVVEGDTLLSIPPENYNSSAPDMGALESGYSEISTRSNSVAPYSASLEIYPNPCNSTLSISVSLIAPIKVISICMFNINGQVVGEYQSTKLHPGQNHFSIDLNDLPASIYFD